MLAVVSNAVKRTDFMRTILLANPKGGCGKSTLAVHLASWFARCDEVVYLGDLDRQQSSRQ